MFEEYQPDVERQDRLDAAAGLAIRPAETVDLPALAQLRAAREGESLDAGRTAMRAKLGSAGLFLVAEHRGATIAYGSAHSLAPPDAPSGWYLTGVVVASEHRRRGVATELTRARLAWIAERAEHAYYVANARNRVSIALHRSFGFRELTRAFAIPGVTFQGGEGILFRADLR